MGRVTRLWKVVSYIGRRYKRGAKRRAEVIFEERRYGMFFILSLRSSRRSASPWTPGGSHYTAGWWEQKGAESRG